MLISQIKKRKTYTHCYWLARQLIAVRDVHDCTYMYMLDFDLCVLHFSVYRDRVHNWSNVQCVCACIVLCVWDQTGSKLGSCDWPSFKMKRPHLALYDFPLEFQWENKETHKLSVTEGSRLLFEYERVRGRNAQPYPRLSF